MTIPTIGVATEANLKAQLKTCLTTSRVPAQTQNIQILTVNMQIWAEVELRPIKWTEPLPACRTVLLWQNGEWSCSELFGAVRLLV